VVTRKPRSEYSFPGACLVGMVSAEPRSLHANQRQLATLARQDADSPDEQTALSPRLCARGKRHDAECRFRKAGLSKGRWDANGTRNSSDRRRKSPAGRQISTLRMIISPSTFRMCPGRSCRGVEGSKTTATRNEHSQRSGCSLDLGDPAPVRLDVLAQRLGHEMVKRTSSLSGQFSCLCIEGLRDCDYAPIAVVEILGVIVGVDPIAHRTPPKALDSQHARRIVR